MPIPSHSLITPSHTCSHLILFSHPKYHRIVNRLTKDTSDIDRQLPGNLGMGIRCFLQLISALILMGSVAPLAMPPLVVIMLGFYVLFQYFQVRC